jgi:hypothetical protein
MRSENSDDNRLSRHPHIPLFRNSVVDEIAQLQNGCILAALEALMKEVIMHEDDPTPKYNL